MVGIASSVKIMQETMNLETAFGQLILSNAAIEKAIAMFRFVVFLFVLRTRIAFLDFHVTPSESELGADGRPSGPCRLDWFQLKGDLI